MSVMLLKNPPSLKSMLFLLALAALAFFSPVMHAAVVINVVESGSNVVATASGSINTAGLPTPGTASAGNAGFVSGSSFQPGFVTSRIAVGSAPVAFVYKIDDTSIEFSTGSNFIASSNSGDFVGVLSGGSFNDSIYTDSRYVSGAAISGSSTWNGRTIVSMGLIPGTYVFTWGAGATADSLTLNIGSVTPPILACTMYTDRASFEAAAPGLPTEDFEKTSAVAEFDSPLDETTNVPPFIVPGDILPGVVFLNPDFLQRLQLFDSEFANMIPDGISLSNSGNDTDSLVVTLNPAVSAFGFDIFSETDSVSVRVYNTNSDLIGRYDGSAPQTGGFVGCISADPIARVVLSAPANSSGNLEALDNVSFGEPSVTPITYTLGGTVSGLTGAGLALQNNGGDTLAIAADGPFTFLTELVDTTAYAVTVSTQPTGQTCSVTGGGDSVGGGAIAGADVTSVVVTCVDNVIPTYSVGGTVSGLTGAGLALQNNGGDTLAIAADGPFTFLTELVDTTAYAVTVSIQPTGQTCSVTTGSGAIAASDVTNILVACIDDEVTPPTPPMVPIPTLSEWALILLAMLLGLMVFANRRRLF